MANEMNKAFLRLIFILSTRLTISKKLLAIKSPANKKPVQLDEHIFSIDTVGKFMKQFNRMNITIKIDIGNEHLAMKLMPLLSNTRVSKAIITDSNGKAQL